MGIGRLRCGGTRFVGFMAVVAIALSGFSSSLVAQAGAPVGIPRELARERAERVSDVRYRLRYTLVPKATETLGHEEIRFQLKAAGPMLLDFREGTVSDVTVNGRAYFMEVR